MARVELDIAVDYSQPDESVRHIFSVLRPQSDITKMKIKDFSTGYVNKNLCCYTDSLDCNGTDEPELRNGSNPHRNGIADTDAIFIRISSTAWKGITDGATYRTVSELLTESEVGPRLLAVFNNGVVHEYVTGEALTWKSRGRLHQNDINRSVLKSLAVLHSRNLYERALRRSVPDNLNEPVVRKRLEIVFKLWDEFIDDSSVPERLKRGLPSSSQLEKERGEITSLLTSQCPERSLCHMDINPSNIIIKHDGSACLVDFDLMSIDYTCMDLAGYFHCFMDVSAPNLADYPDSWFRRQSLRYYLECRRQLQDDVTVREGEVIDHVTAKDTDTLYNFVQICRLYWLWRFTLGGPTVYKYSPDRKQAERMVSHCGKMWEEYKRFKSELVKSGLFPEP